MVDIRKVDLSIADYPVCDFCSSPEPRYVESAQDFDVYFAIDEQGKPEVGVSRGGWASCAACHELVRARKWYALERRAIDAIAAKHPEFSRSRVQEGVRTMHAKFQQHRSPV